MKHHRNRNAKSVAPADQHTRGSNGLGRTQERPRCVATRRRCGLRLSMHAEDRGRGARTEAEDAQVDDGVPAGDLEHLLLRVRPHGLDPGEVQRPRQPSLAPPGRPRPVDVPQESARTARPRRRV